MSHVEIDRRIPAPAARVWAALSDYQGVHKFNPFVEKAELLTPQACGLGAERECRMYGGKDFVHERIVEWSEGRSFAVDIVASSMPLASARVRISVDPLGSDASRVTFATRYQPKFGLLGRLMDVVMLRWMMRRMGRKLLLGLEDHLRTGAVVGKGGVLEAHGLRRSEAGARG